MHMAVSTRIIRRRIRSVSNTKKITKAMELVAASKMRRAVASVLSSRPYAEAAWRAVKEISKSVDPALHPLLAPRSEPVGKQLLIIFTSDRGLCGGFNAQIVKACGEFLKKNPATVDIVACGKKGSAALLRTGRTIVAAFNGFSNAPKATDAKTVADLGIKDFTEGKYDEVHVAFTDYRSALVQKPIVRRILPIAEIPELGVGEGTVPERGLSPEQSGSSDYLFEPSPQSVLDTILPRIVESQIYQALLESSASEHSARMLAMRSATDAAGEMIDDLTLAFNQARQSGITREIAEISSGKAALE